MSTRAFATGKRFVLARYPAHSWEFLYTCSSRWKNER